MQVKPVTPLERIDLIAASVYIWMYDWITIFTFSAVCILLLLPPATKLGQGYVFTGVCHSGGEYLTPPGTRYTPRTRYTPSPGTCTPPPLGPVHPLPWDQVHPPDQVHPQDQVPPPPRPGTPRPRRRACSEIRSMSGRYAYYWNAILFFLIFTFEYRRGRWRFRNISQEKVRRDLEVFWSVRWKWRWKTNGKVRDTVYKIILPSGNYMFSET